MIRFSEIHGHRYETVTDHQKWESVTTILSCVKEKFSDSIADKNSIDPSSKWYGIPGDEIRAIWKAEALRSTTLGSWYHHKKEWGEVNAIRCVESDGWKYAMSQQLLDGVYPEFITYHQEYQVAGQIDRLEICNNKILVSDYKSNKKIDTQSWNGRKMMLKPVQHLQECNLNSYSLQLSTYAAFVQYHNPWMEVGDLVLKHVQFEQEGVCKFGYPITAKDANGDYIVKSVTDIPVRFMKDEVKAILEYHKTKSLPMKAG